MPTVFSTSPHFDDFNEEKEFVRILFRPGRAVQARELTQLQTIIQSQVERFGRGIYKDGSFVSPPSETFDPNFAFVKLENSVGGVEADSVVSSLIGQLVKGETTGVVALVIDVATSTVDGDPPTLFVKYTDGGTSNLLVFNDNEEIKNTNGSITVQALSSGATGFGTTFSIGKSTIFAKGNFLLVQQQTHIIEKYANVQNKIVGLTVTESVVESTDDTSLLDPATGTFNFFAPGADRYKANLTLSSRDLEFNSLTDTNFIEVVRVEDGRVISKNIDPRFSVLGDTLARRTFDESGNYEVETFGLELREHLKSSPTGTNTFANIATTSNDGVFLAANGGSNAKFVSVITPGKAFVKGYEVDDIPSRFLTMDKARNFANVSTGTIASQLSSFVTIDDVNSAPDLAIIETVNLRDAYKSSNVGQNGNLVGTAKSRGLIYQTGNVAPALGGAAGRTASFRLHLFDINMNDGKTFDRDAKQVEASTNFDFAANITPVLTNLSGAITYNNASTTVLGSGTRFSSQLKVGDVITHSNSTFTHRLIVSAIADDVTLTIDRTPLGNIANSFAPFSLNTSNIGDSSKDILITQFPFEVLKAVDPANTKTTYTVKRQITQSLSSGAATLTTGTNETFAPFSTDNYQAIITSGTRRGQYISIQSGDISFNGGSTQVTFDFSGSPGENLNNESMEFIVTVNKVTSAALRKTKTLNANQTIDFTTKETAQASILTLGKADGFKLKSVKMSNVAFGSSYTDSGSSDVTERYSFDNGQKSTFYDLAKVKLKAGKAKPEHPIRVTFDFFAHGAGDFFSVGSYPDYEDIPTVEFNGVFFSLRDCLDFRPRINDVGTGFTGTGASTTEFLDPEVNFVTDYQYFLPKISSVGLNEKGNFFVVEGTSELSPREPNFPSDLLKLFVFQQKPYVFNINRDIEVKRVENKRFTMKDIGRLENRVKTLEFYTTLNLLERDAQQEQIQDDLGFERFKNGFVVDSFTGHGVGDSLENPDYAVSVNYTKKEASPLIKSEFINMREASTTDAQRTSNNYVLTGSVASLPYTHEILVRNPFSSKTQNLNPFNLNQFQGAMTLSPPGDLWFDDKRVPQVQVDRTGSFETLSTLSFVKRDGRNIFGSLNDIEQLRNGVPQNTDELPENLKGLSDLLGSISPATSSLKLQGNEIVKNITVVPKMRSAFIKVNVEGMRPNTQVFGFFDGQPIQPFLSQVTAEIKTKQLQLAANIATNAAKSDTRVTRRDLSNLMSNSSLVLTTDNFGSIELDFHYVSTSLNINTGKKLLRLSSSPINDQEAEVTFAEQVFVSDGVIREITTEVLRPAQPPQPPTPTVKDPQIPPEIVPQKSILEQVYADIRGNIPPDQIVHLAFGGVAREQDREWWEKKFPGVSTKTDASEIANVEEFFQSFAQGATTHGEQDKETQGGVADQFGDASRVGYYTQEEAQAELAADFNNKYL